MLVILLCGFVLKSCVVDFYIVRSKSMMPEYEKGDRLLVSRLYYFIGFPSHLPLLNITMPMFAKIRYKEIRHGDIVAFELEQEGEYTTLVKRVAGVPGDTIILDETGFYVNNIFYRVNVLRQALLMGKMIIPACGESIEENILTKYLISEYFRDGQSSTVDEYYFLVGDNLSNSIDSRNFGLVARNSIIGSPVLKY